MTVRLRRFSEAVGTGLVLSVALARGAAAQLGGTLDLQYGLPSFSWLRPELLGDFGVMGGASEPVAVRWDLGARLHTTGTTGVWLGAAVGAAGIGSPQRSLIRLEGGVRHSLGPALVDLWLSSTGFGAGLTGLAQDSARPDTLARRGITDYTDLGSRVTFGLNRYELGLSLTRRMGRRISRRTGWELSATWWMAPSIGLVGSAGHSLPQLGFVVPGGRYGTVGLRLALGARSPASQPRGNTTGTKAAAGPTVVVAGRRLTIRAAPAQRAEVMGDFTDWKPVPLTSSGAGQWILPLELTPGVHHLNVRFDGGPWLVPSGAFAVDDGFGGRVGLLIVR